MALPQGFQVVSSIGQAEHSTAYRAERKRIARTFLKSARTIRLLDCPYKIPLRIAHSMILDAEVNYIATPSRQDPLTLQPDFRWEQLVGL